MSTIGVSTVVIITVISAIIIITVSIGIWSVIQHKHRQQRSTTIKNNDEEHQMTLIPNAAVVAGAGTEIAPPKPANKIQPIILPSQAQRQNQGHDHDNDLQSPRFSFDKNSVDGLEEIDLAVPEGHHHHNLGKEQEDPLVERPRRVMSRLPAWV